VGWVDDDGDPDTPRKALGVPGVPGGTALSVELVTGRDILLGSLAEAIRADLEACGASVEVTKLDRASLTAPWPGGRIFGRRFDLALWLWPVWLNPLCEGFASWEIPSDGHPFGINAGGYSAASYDRACRTILSGWPGAAGHERSLEDLLRVLSDDLPSIPILRPPRWVAHRPDLWGWM